MKIKINGVLFNMALMFAIMLGFIPGIETAMTVHAADDSGVCSSCGNIAWELDGTTLTISKVADARYGDICGNCHSEWDTYDLVIVEVVIEDGVTEIGYDAFNGCSNLASVIIPDSVWNIKGSAFRFCESLTNVAIPDNVTSIGSGAFYGCYSLTSITIPKGITFIDPQVFSGCSLTSITIPSGVTGIGYEAFSGCDMTSIIIPDGVTSIGDEAFSGCGRLTSITIPNSVTSIGEQAFESCISLTSITIPDGVTHIGFMMFVGCSSLTEVVIPNSVTSIERSAFWNCSSLTDITIPNSVTSIGESAFACCSSLTSITIPTNVTVIESGVFNSCSNLTSIRIPDGVTSIGNSAFVDCSSLTEIEIPNSVKSIEAYAFDGCSNLTSIRIPDGVPSIENYTFCGCSGLTNISIPDSVTSIGEYAFINCSSLTDITIPDGITNIGNKAFCGCDELTGIRIPDGITSIEDSAFYGCKSLTDITIPDSVTTIGGYAFSHCFGLTNITIPESVTSIENLAFSWCESLATVSCPCTLKEQVSVNKVFYCSFPATITYNHLSPTYTVNDTTDTLSLTCASCENAYTVTLKAPTKTTYTGKPIEVTCTGISDDFMPTITYSGNKLVDGKPVYPGTYTATLTYGDKKVSLKYTIEEAVAPAPAKPNKITNVVSGVHVYWPAVSGASKYGLWRSETGVNGTYKWIANPTVAHFTDTKVESGKTYYYKVTTLDTVNNVHSAKSAAIGITYVATPDITSRANQAAGIKLGWEKIVGATGYAIYRKPYVGNADWVRVATINSPSTLTWTDESVKTANGSMYKYTIRALAGSDRKTLSGCRPQGRTMVRLTSRTLSSATKATATSIKCSWSTTSQATGYEVRFMAGSTVYKTFTVGNYKTGVKTFTGLKAGQTYKIQVRAYKKVEGVGTLYSAWSTPKTVSL